MIGRGVRARFAAVLAGAVLAVGVGAGCAAADVPRGDVVTDVAPRLFGEGELLEDESPFTGAHGGALVSYSGDGVACYSDHTATDGRGWFYVSGCGR